MSENINHEIYTELANRIYDLDAEVYHVLGSSLGRTFTGNRDTTIRTLSMLMYTKPDGHLLRSELALISNMARTIKDPAEKSRLMTEYDEILKAIEQLPNMFGSTDILDAERVALNLAARREKISENEMGEENKERMVVLTPREINEMKEDIDEKRNEEESKEPKAAGSKKRVVVPATETTGNDEQGRV